MCCLCGVVYVWYAFGGSAVCVVWCVYWGVGYVCVMCSVVQVCVCGVLYVCGVGSGCGMVSLCVCVSACVQSYPGIHVFTPGFQNGVLNKERPWMKLYKALGDLCQIRVGHF